MNVEESREVSVDRVSPLQATAADYLALAKPGLTVMSAATAIGGAFLGAGGSPSPYLLLNLLLGTILVGTGAATLNQWLERKTDALMKRTERRPFPSGKVNSPSGVTAGLLCGLAGTFYLYNTTTPAAGIIAAAVLLVYLAAYTPLKRVHHLATAVGGIPGALPPVIGWVSAGRGFSIEAYLLFLVLFIWQMPHFLSLAWMYRRDYERGGYRLLPHYDATGAVTGRLVLLYTAALMPVTTALFVIGLMGWVFLLGSLAAGVGFLVVSLNYSRDITNDRARRVFLASLLYLSTILLLMLVDRALVG